MGANAEDIERLGVSIAVLVSSPVSGLGLGLGLGLGVGVGLGEGGGGE